MKNLIIEGLSGCGKSTIIRNLTKTFNKRNISHTVFDEEKTFGNLMDEIKDESAIDKCFRLNNVIQEIKQLNNELIIFERFHLSYYAVLSDWDLYSDIDLELGKNNFAIVLLTYNDNLIPERALNHFDIKNTDSLKLFIEYFGSLENAINAYKESQNKRIEALNKTKLDYIKIDTSEKSWTGYEQKILNFIETK